MTSRTTPVYLPFATILSALDALRKHPVFPGARIDQSVRNSPVHGQLLPAFRFLGLTDAQNCVLPVLPPLVAASASDRKPLLKKIIEDSYRDVIGLGLSTMSPGQLNEAFGTFDITGSTLKAATRFFLTACTELDIPIAKWLSEKTRATGRRKKRSPDGSRKPEYGQQDPPLSALSRRLTWEEQLLAKFPDFDPTWPEPLKIKWFEGFDRLMGAKPGESNTGSDPEHENS